MTRTDHDVAHQAREYLSTKEVSDLTGIPVGTWRFWRHRGQGPESFTLGTKRVVYRRSEIERWIADQEASTRRGGTPEVA